MKKPTKSPSGKKSKKLLADEDYQLWHSVTQSIKPLHKNRISAIGIPEAIVGKPDLGAQAGFRQIERPLERPLERPRALPVHPGSMPSRILNPGIPPMTHEGAPGLDRRTKARMKRGKIDIEARLDLHGYYRDQAQQVLQAFISRAYHSGLKSVLVVTGKGLKEDGRIGVLRQAVPGWLNADPLRHFVHAFSYASPRDGGQGALYILMKKKRTQTNY